MKRIVALMLLGLICVYSSAQLPLDEDGWTIITASDDSRIIYVSSSEGSDDNDGLSELTPVESLSKGVSLARDGYPDHILFKRGDEWFTKYGIGTFKSGRSATEPMVLAYYGESGPRPRFNIENSFFAINSIERSHLVFMGLEWYGYKHDPNSPDFTSATKVGVFAQLGYGENFLIEDCVANYVSLGAFAPANHDTYYKNVKLRYVIAFQSYGPDSYNIHELYSREQGIYVSNTEGFLMEHCLMDHNGWNEEVEGSGANMYNHNLYMSGCNPDPSKIILKDNIFARGAAHGVQLRSGGTATGNLFIQNAISINIGYDYLSAGFDDMIQWVKDMDNTTVSDNVFLESRLMDSTNSSWPRTAAVWGIATIAIPCRVNNNIIAHSLNDGGNAISSYNDINGLGGSVEKIGNVIFKFHANTSNETVDPGWLDPERKIGHYHRKLGGEVDTKAFLLAARKRPLKTLWPEYSAEVVNNFIRDGFSEMEDVNPPANTASLLIDPITDASVVLSWGWAIDDQRTIGYNIYVDGVKVNQELEKDTSCAIYELDAETEYTVIVKTVDVAGNESSGSSENFTTLEMDITAPSVPEGLEQVGVTDNSFTLAWIAATDNRAIWGYYLYVDSEKVTGEVVTDTVFTVDGLEMGVSYQVFVSALDPAGNESEKSTGLEVRVLDSEAPGSPENLYLSDITATSLVLHWDAAMDNVGVTGYNLYQGNSLVASTGDLEYMFQDLEVGGRYRFSVTAADMDGNESGFTTYQLVMGVGEESCRDAFLIYPSPADESLNLFSETGIEYIHIYSTTGRVLRSIAGNGLREQGLDVSMLNSGIYFIRINGIDHQQVGRFVKK